MRTTRRLAVATALVGGSLLLAGPAAGQTVPCDEYDTLAECPIGGGGEQPAIGTPGGGEQPAVGTPGGGSGGSGTGTIVRGSAGGAGSLPVTGGELTLIALAGTAALGGGVALTAAGRKRKAL